MHLRLRSSATPSAFMVTLALEGMRLAPLHDKAFLRKEPMSQRGSGLHRRAFFDHASVGMTAGFLAGGSLAGEAATDGNREALHLADHRQNVKDFGARGDGTTDDTAAIQATIDATGKSGGGRVFLPAGFYETTATLRCSAHSIAICGEGAATTLRPLGNFDTIRFAGDRELYRNSIFDIAFDERKKTGGSTIVGERVAQFVAERVYGISGWNGWHFHNFNCVTLNDCRFEGYRGVFFGRATGGGQGHRKGRIDVLRLTGLVHSGSRTPGIVGLDIDGFVHTINGVGVYLVGIGAEALRARNTIGAESNPSFFAFVDFEADYPGGEAIRLDVGEHFYFTNALVHATRKAASNIYIGPGVTGVTLTNGFSTGSHQAGIHVEGRSVTISAMHFHANSSTEFGGTKGKYPGILIGKEARDIIVTGCHAGREAVHDFQSCGCEIKDGADGILITDNDFRHNISPGVKNHTGAGSTTLVANNL